MAKKAKRTAKATARAAKKSEPVAPADVMKVPSEPKLKSLLRACKGADADRNEASGRKGSLISNAVEKDHLDKKAWSVACSLERMSVQKAATAWAHLQYYIDALGLQERFDAQEEMFAKPEIGETEQEQDEAAPPKAAKGNNGKPEPRPGSFAEKLATQQAEARTASLTPPGKAPSAEEIKRIADKAENTTAH